MKTGEQTIALDLLRRHPGWSDPRVADELGKRKLHVSASSVHAWRVEAGLAPHTQNVRDYPPPRLPGTWLACGHLVHPENLRPGDVGHCDYCGRDAATAAGADSRAPAASTRPSGWGIASDRWPL